MSTMKFDQKFHNGKTHTCTTGLACSRFVYLFKAFKHLIKFCFRDTATGIRHQTFYESPASSCRNADIASGGKLYRVSHQIKKYLCQPNLVSDNNFTMGFIEQLEVLVFGRLF